MPPGVPFPQFATALTNGTDKPDLHLRSGIAIIPPPRPAFVGGKGSPCKKKKGSLCEEESYSLVRSQRISRQGGRGKNNIQISEGSNRFLTGRGRGRGFLHPARQGQAHRRFRAGKEAVVAILGPGHFFGEGCLNGHPLRIATTRAVDECVITRLEKATMIATIHNEPEFSELFMSYLLTRNSRIEEDLVDQLFNSSEKRLARLLLLLANFGKEGRPEPIVGKFSQETLAEMIGTTRSRVSFFMNKFRKLGFIEYNGKLEVHNSLLNVVLYDKPEIKTRDASTST